MQVEPLLRMLGPEIEAITPPELKRVVSRLAYRSRVYQRRVSAATEHLCCASLRPGREGIRIENWYAYELSWLKAKTRPKLFTHFWSSYCENTEASIFASFFQLRTDLLAQHAKRRFSEFLAVATTQHELINLPPLDWAEQQAWGLVRQQLDQTARWVQGVCIRGKNGLDYDGPLVEELWCAPRFLEAEFVRDWTPLRPEATRTHLEYLSFSAWNEVHNSISFAADREALAEAKRAPLRRLSLADVTQTCSMLEQSPEDKRVAEFQHTTDYLSVTFLGKRHALTRRQAKIVCLLHKGYLNGEPDVPKERLLDAVGPDSSTIRDALRRSSVWRTLVSAGSRRGTYRLLLSESKTSEAD